jgi:hypothetical protein
VNEIATTERSTMNAVAMSSGPSGSSIAPQSLGDVVRFAEVMCRADIALPAHLRGNAGACMAVAMQALEWQMSPFAVASKSYSVSGRIAYEAQLIAAVVNTRSGIKGRLRYEFNGEGAALTCRVVGVLDGDECEYVSPPVGSITPKNSPLWKTDPQQQLGYFSARSWARRHCPEVILGVYDREEVDQMRGAETAKDVTPLSERLAIAKIEQHDATEASEGFDRSFVTRETSEPASEAAIDQETSSPAHTADDAAAESSSPQGSAADQSAGSSSQESSGEGVQAPVDGTTAPSPPVRTKAECIKAFMTTATNTAMEVKERRDLLATMKDWWKAEMPADLDFVKACLTTADKVAKGELGAKAAQKYLESLP